MDKTNNKIDISNLEYKLGEYPDLPAPKGNAGIINWVRKNLFSNLFSGVLTLLAIFIIFKSIPPLINWAFIDASWIGTDDSNNCVKGGGACWTYVNSKLSQFTYGAYIETEIWRLNIVFFMLASLIIYLVIPKTPKKYIAGIIMFTIFPIISYILIAGGVFGLMVVPVDKWGGFALTIIISFVGIFASLPLGILLALGRQSKMPIIKTSSVIFIEFWRGVPLITVLFMASYMVPLFLPKGVEFDKLLRVLICIVIFASAYMAEVIRGGLQAVPKGQVEAAQSLGISYWKTMILIVLPQALKIVIPGIVNIFIGLFKDTTLVAMVNLSDFLGIIQTASSDSHWSDLNIIIESYVFAAFIYFLFCFAMSRYSLSLERKLHTGHKR